MIIDICDVEHGQCAIIHSPMRNGLAMVDCGHNATRPWRPSDHIRNVLRRSRLDYLLITNADQDHFSDLWGLTQDVTIGTFYCNRTLRPEALRELKLQQDGGCITNDAAAYMHLQQNYVHAIPVPFEQGMEGVVCRPYWNTHRDGDNTNDSSLVVFLEWQGFKILFPGDLEPEGWRRLMQQPGFLPELPTTTILVASHHGRTTGFCPEAFRYLRPQAVVISDKDPVHDTQDTLADYAAVVPAPGINVGGKEGPIRVLRTYAHGHIRFTVGATHYTVTTQL